MQERIRLRHPSRAVASRVSRPAHLAARSDRLQSFPDDFDYVCALRATERQIGNTVPPVLAWQIAKTGREQLVEVLAIMPSCY